MRAMRSDEFEIDTRGRLVSDITDRVQSFTADAGGEGLLHVFLPHATAGLALMETGSGSEEDLANVVEELLPRDDRYRHRHGSPGHGADHLLPAFVSPSLTLAVQGGRVILGTWQSIVVVDPNRENNRRRIMLSLLEG
jgi:secondary thiamine-phosphate synthase enzyme